MPSRINKPVEYWGVVVVKRVLVSRKGRGAAATGLEPVDGCEAADFGSVLVGMFYLL